MQHVFYHTSVVMRSQVPQTIKVTLCNLLAVLYTTGSGKFGDLIFVTQKNELMFNN